MSEEMINRLRSGIEEFNRTGALDGGLLAADVEFRQADSIVDTAGTFVGKDGLRAAFQELRETFRDRRLAKRVGFAVMSDAQSSRYGF